MCQNYWDNPLAGDKAKRSGSAKCGKEGCGGPMGGQTFPLYDGPLGDGDWTHFCFVCGNPDVENGIQLASPDATRKLGVCREHIQLVDEYAPATEQLHQEKKIILLPRTETGVPRTAKRGD
jgi:hypothetical protein